MLHTKGVPVETMAIAYHNLEGASNTPVSPCGVLRRQYLQEYEDRTETHPFNAPVAWKEPFM